MIDIEKLCQEAEKEIAAAKNADALFAVEKKYLGRADGEVVKILRSLKDLPVEERKIAGPKIQSLKKRIEDLASRQRIEIENAVSSESEKYFDISMPPARLERGSAHPIAQFLDRALDIFTRMGFEIVEEREVENEAYNFDLLNVPADHPARDLQDTYYVKNPKPEDITSDPSLVRRGKGRSFGKLLLRTHTSNSQVRTMESRKPPVRIICPGRVFRNEATDVTHETTFYQVEGLVIDKNISVGDLIGAMREFFDRMYYDKDIKIRIRPHFYPFVEPGMDIDISCIFCGQKGCSACKHSGWIESLGSGLVHPTVLKNMGVDPKIYSGFAFGFGIDRMVMLYYGISDIRLLYSGDLRFLKQF